MLDNPDDRVIFMHTGARRKIVSKADGCTPKGD